MATIILGDIVTNVKEVVNPKTCGLDKFVGLEHYDAGEPMITRYGSPENLDTNVKHFCKGDIMVARRNVYLKRAGYVDFEGVTSGDSIVLRVTDEKYKRILPFILNTDDFWDYAEQNADGTMSKRLSPDDLLDYEFEEPENIEEMSDKLWAAYKVKESYRQLLTATDDMVKAKFKKMFGDTSTTPIYKLAAVCSFKSGTTFKDGEELSSGDYPYIKVADMNLIGNEYQITQSHKYVSKETAKNTWLPSGTVIFPKRGAAIATNKKRLLVQPTCADLNIIGVIPSNKINPIYLYWFFRGIDLSSICDNSGIPQINNKNLEPMDIPVPSMEMQQEFAAIATQAEATKASLRESIASIDRVIRSLINQ